MSDADQYRQKDAWNGQAGHKTPAARGKMVDHLAHYTLWKAKPVRRVYIAKANGKLRPLGIPVIVDRCLQAMVKNALEPAWEAQFEGSSYGCATRTELS